MGVATGCGCKEVYRFPHSTYPYSSCICSFLQQHPYFLFIVNPWRACAARVTVVVLCVCMCVCVSTHTCRLTHWNHKREIPILRNTVIVLNFADFPKNALFKSYGVICLPGAASVS